MSKTYTVKAGESWESIAGNIYGDQRMFAALMKANGGGMLHPGDTIKLINKQSNPYVGNQDIYNANVGTSFGSGGINEGKVNYGAFRPDGSQIGGSVTNWAPGSGTIWNAYTGNGTLANFGTAGTGGVSSPAVPTSNPESDYAFRNAASRPFSAPAAGASTPATSSMTAVQAYGIAMGQGRIGSAVNAPAPTPTLTPSPTDGRLTDYAWRHQTSAAYGQGMFQPVPGQSAPIPTAGNYAPTPYQSPFAPPATQDATTATSTANLPPLATPNTAGQISVQTQIENTYYALVAEVHPPMVNNWAASAATDIYNQNKMTNYTTAEMMTSAGYVQDPKTGNWVHGGQSTAYDGSYYDGSVPAYAGLPSGFNDHGGHNGGHSRSGRSRRRNPNLGAALSGAVNWRIG